MTMDEEKVLLTKLRNKVYELQGRDVIDSPRQAMEGVRHCLGQLLDVMIKKATIAPGGAA